MNIMKRLCCCSGDEDDGMPYERFYDESRVTPVRREDPRINGRPMEETDNTEKQSERKRVNTREELEEEALNRILENFQHNIIDVSHLDGMTLNTSDYLARAQQYEEAIRLHDHSASRAASDVSRISYTGKRLIEDSGSKVVDWLCKPGPTREAYAEIQQLTAEIHEVIAQGMVVQHKTDLVVYMDL
uniref:Ragulator complex protein LAMTOR1 n=1 Tax=Angiostrongylus cantonensis TaxID=6313 RepID=A0A158P9U7_ANGCA